VRGLPTSEFPKPVQTLLAEIPRHQTNRTGAKKQNFVRGRRALRPASPEPKTRDHLAADHIAEGMRAHTIARGAGDHHERQKVLLARVAGAR
jgi:hypothetical protein